MFKIIGRISKTRNSSQDVGGLHMEQCRMWRWMIQCPEDSERLSLFITEPNPSQFRPNICFLELWHLSCGDLLISKFMNSQSDAPICFISRVLDFCPGNALFLPNKHMAAQHRSHRHTPRKIQQELQRISRLIHLRRSSPRKKVYLDNKTAMHWESF